MRPWSSITQRNKSINKYVLDISVGRKRYLELVLEHFTNPPGKNLSSKKLLIIIKYYR